MSSNIPTGNGIGLGSVLFIVFLVLKLCHVIDWSWWWVTSPLWGSLAIGCGIFLVGIVISIIVLACRR